MKISSYLLTVVVGVLLALLCGCTAEKKPESVSELFPVPISLSCSAESFVPEDSLAVVEGLACSGRNLVVYDLQSGESYVLFDALSGEYITRFGRIGQGPGEISSGSYGCLSDGRFVVFDDATKNVTAYDMDTLRNGARHGGFVWRQRYDIGDGQLSRLAFLGDGLFFGAGLLDSHYQYILFDSDNHIHDTAVEVYNSEDTSFDRYTRFLSNQGDLVMNCSGKRLACALNFSSNIDFLAVDEGKIRLVKSLRLKNPLYLPESSGGIYSASVTPESFWGYISLCSTDKYVYALYSDKKVMESGRCSSTVLVYDWDGNPVRSFQLDVPAFHIAADETDSRLFVSLMDEEHNWKISVYDLK